MWPMEEGNGIASHACAHAELHDGSPFRNSAASDSSMWRAMFLAVGISMCILGGECLVVEKFVLGAEGPPPTAQSPMTLFGAPPASAAGPASRDIEPADWAPWSLLSAGAVIILYAVTLNRQG
jgi:hypothetical protein